MRAKQYGDRAHFWLRSATKPPRIFLTALPSYDPVAFHWAHARSFRTTENSQPVHIVEQDHRGVKRVTRPMLGFKAFGASQDTLVGIELMHMIRKKQIVVEA